MTRKQELARISKQNLKLRNILHQNSNDTNAKKRKASFCFSISVSKQIYVLEVQKSDLKEKLNQNHTKIYRKLITIIHKLHYLLPWDK